MAASEHSAAGFPVPPLARRLFALAEAGGVEARIVGGAVRDWLAADRPGHGPEGRAQAGDIDMAVAAPIADFARLCRDDGLRVIETGIDHGTVTIIDPAIDPAPGAAGNGAIEVTQTRLDLATDGRHAVVGFSDDWAADAERRDFTINAIYIRADGSLDDPLGGIDDLRDGRLRFAGEAARRVEEDALRMLRYCRFLPRFGAGGVDADAEAAIRSRAASASRLSGERVAAECRRLFGMHGGNAGIRLMRESGLDEPSLGTRLVPDNLAVLSGAGDLAAVAPDSRWLVRLAALTPAASADVLADRLRLSRRERRLLAGLDLADAAAMAARLTGDDWRRTAYFLAGDGMPPAAVLIVAATRAGMEMKADHLAELAGWVPPEPPLAAADLLSHGVDRGPALGEMLRAAEQHWVAHDFTPSRQDLLAFVTDRLTHD